MGSLVCVCYRNVYAVIIKTHQEGKGYELNISPHFLPPVLAYFRLLISLLFPIQLSTSDLFIVPVPQVQVPLLTLLRNADGNSWTMVAALSPEMVCLDFLLLSCSLLDVIKVLV